MKNNEMLEEGIKETFSTATAIYIAKMLATRFENWDMYKLDLIDKDGKRTDKNPTTSEEKKTLNLLDNFIRKLKLILLTFVRSETLLKSLIGLYILNDLRK